MRKFLSISLALLALTMTALAQTNTVYVNSTNLPTATPVSADYTMFLKWTGVKFAWYRDPINDFYNNFTNFPGGQALWQGVTNRATIAQLSTSSNSLQSQITSNLSSANTASNSLQSQITANLSSANTASNSLQSQITANLSSANTASNSLQSQITANLNSANTASNSLQTQVSSLLTANNSATFSKVTTTNIAYRVVDLGTNPATTVTIDLSLAGFQILAVTNKSATTFVLTNYAPGQAVHVLIKNGDTTGRAFNSPVTGTFSGSTGYTVGAGLYQSYQFYSFGNSAAQTATYESH